MWQQSYCSRYSCDSFVQPYEIATVYTYFTTVPPFVSRISIERSSFRLAQLTSFASATSFMRQHNIICLCNIVFNNPSTTQAYFPSFPPREALGGKRYSFAKFHCFLYFYGQNHESCLVCIKSVSKFCAKWIFHFIKISVIIIMLKYINMAIYVR